MATYRTRSNTQKLQRLIDFLKERDSDCAANLESSAEVFLNDVKPKYKPGEIPFYDGTESDAGSSYVEEGQEEDWDWEEEWEDCGEPVEEPAGPSLPPLPASPPKAPSPIIAKEPSPPRQPSPPPLEVLLVKKTEPKQESSIPFRRQSTTPSLSTSLASFARRDSKASTSNGFKASAVVLSGVERSSDIASPLMKFPTLPVSIPNFFGSNNSTITSSSSKKSLKEKKKTQVPEDAVESVLVDSMAVAAAVAVPIDPMLAQMTKNNGNEDKSEALNGKPERSSPVRIRKLTRQHEIDICDSPELSSNSMSSFERVEKSPLRSILKKSTTPSSHTHSHASSTDVSETLPPDEQCYHFENDQVETQTATVLSCSPCNVSFAIPEVTEFQHETYVERIKKSPEPSKEYAKVSEIPPKSQSYREVFVTIEGPLEHPKPASPPDKSKSKLSALMQETQQIQAPPSPKTKKTVTLQVPDTPEKTPKPKPPGSPAVPRRPAVKPQPQIQYEMPENANIPKVEGQRSRKPTLASQWRKQKEKQKMEEKALQDKMDTFGDLWPYTSEDTSVPSIQALAEAGFYFLGLNDLVQCSECQTSLGGWNMMETNDPWTTHVQASPTCPFLLRTKGSDWIDEQVKAK